MEVLFLTLYSAVNENQNPDLFIISSMVILMVMLMYLYTAHITYSSLIEVYNASVG